MTFKDFFHGQPSIVVFFYTRCDNPMKCSLTVAKLARVQAITGGTEAWPTGYAPPRSPTILHSISPNVFASMDKTGMFAWMPAIEC